MKLSERELVVMQAVLSALFDRFNNSELNYFLGSETIIEARTLHAKLYYRGYCEEHGIRYEDMTCDDFENAALEESERYVQDVCGGWL